MAGGIIERKSFLRILTGTILGGVGVSRILALFGRADDKGQLTGAAHDRAERVADPSGDRRPKVHTDPRTVSHGKRPA